MQQPRNINTFDPHAMAEFLPTDASDGAEFIARILPNLINHEGDSGTWYIWDGRVHKPYTSDTVPSQLVDTLGFALKEVFDYVDNTIDATAKAIKSAGGPTADKDAAAYRKDTKALFTEAKAYAKDLNSNRGVRNTLDKLARRVAKAPDYFGDDRRWFVVENGVYDMQAVRRDRRFDLLPHDAARPVYRYFPVTAVDGAEASNLRTFLSQSIADESQVRFYSKAVAWAMMGAPAEATKTIVSVQGATNSGKSMMNRVIESFCGGPTSTFYAEPDADAVILYPKGNPRHARDEMKRARYVGFTEVKDRLKEDFVLQYSGGDICKSEQKYVQAEGWRPQGIMFFASNDGMKIDTAQPAIYARVAPVHFPHTFHPKEEAAVLGSPYVQDEGLEGRIRQEASGILEWMKEHYLLFLDEGLERSASMNALRLDTRDAGSSALQFLDDGIERGLYKVDPDAKKSHGVLISGLHESYVEWCRKHGIRDYLDQTAFSRHVQTRFKTGNSGGRRFLGLVPVIKSTV